MKTLLSSFPLLILLAKEIVMGRKFRVFQDLGDHEKDI